MNKSIMKQEIEEIFLKDMQMKASTVIWTAGVRANELFEKAGLPVDKRGRVEVDETLHAKGEKDIYAIGDGAITKFSGYAQIAFYDGKFVAKVIAAELHGGALPTYDPSEPVNAIPAGDGWAGVLIKLWGSEIMFFGTIGWWFRRLADLRSFMVVLPLWKAFRIWFGGCISEKCDICSVEAPQHPHA